jgi:hypothetical protein
VAQEFAQLYRAYSQAYAMGRDKQQKRKRSDCRRVVGQTNPCAQTNAGATRHRRAASRNVTAIGYFWCFCL